MKLCPQNAIIISCVCAITNIYDTLDFKYTCLSSSACLQFWFQFLSYDRCTDCGHSFRDIWPIAGLKTSNRRKECLSFLPLSNFRGVKFSRFCSICKIFRTVDSYNKDECLERYRNRQVPLAVVVDRTFTSGCVDWPTCLFNDDCHVKFYFCALNFCDWAQPQNYFNSEIFPMYGI